MSVGIVLFLFIHKSYPQIATKERERYLHESSCRKHSLNYLRSLSKNYTDFVKQNLSKNLVIKFSKHPLV